MTYSQKQKALGRHHLETRLASLRQTDALARPQRGWIRALRDALGMTTEQLAERLGVSQPRISQLEHAELEGSLTLASMKAAAEAMNCTLVYALVPNAPMEEILRHRAEILADKQLKRTHHTMKLENQALSNKDLNKQRERLIEKFLEGNTHRLWDE